MQEDSCWWFSDLQMPGELLEADPESVLYHAHIQCFVGAEEGRAWAGKKGRGLWFMRACGLSGSGNNRGPCRH